MIVAGRMVLQLGGRLHPSVPLLHKHTNQRKDPIDEVCDAGSHNKRNLQNPLHFL
jgi:hypothetical protein